MSEPNLLTVQQARQRMKDEIGHAPSTPAMYRLIKDARLQALKVAGRVLILETSLTDLIFDTLTGI